MAENFLWKMCKTGKLYFIRNPWKVQIACDFEIFEFVAWVKN